MTRFPVHDLCDRIHSRTNLFEMDVKHWLRNLAELKQSGFSPETTPMMQLRADIRTLRTLADMLDIAETSLTQPEHQNESV